MADPRHQLRIYLEGTVPVDVDRIASSPRRADAVPVRRNRHPVLVALAAAAVVAVLGIPALLLFDRDGGKDVAGTPEVTTIPGPVTTPATMPPATTSPPDTTTGGATTDPSTTTTTMAPVVTSPAVSGPTVSVEQFLATNCVADITVGSDGTIWAVCGSDVYTFDHGAWTLAAPGGPIGIFDIEVAGDGTLVAASWDAEESGPLGYNGYLLSTFKSGTWRSTPFEVIGDIDAGPDGTVWAATGESCLPEPCAPTPLLRLDGDTWGRVPGSHPSTPTSTGETLFEWSRISVAEDGSVWVTNNLGGFLYHWDGELTQAYDGVDDIWAAPDGSLWVQTSPAAYGDWGIVQYRNGDWIAHPELGTRQVSGMAFSNDGQVWAVSSGFGVMFFDGGEWHHLTTENGLRTLALTAVALDPENEVWIGTQAGLYRCTLNP